jgi:uncharacterized protein
MSATGGSSKGPRGRMTRRGFVAGCTASAALVGLGGCTDSPEAGMPCAAEPAGSTRDLRRFSSFRDLERLDYFELGDDGRLRCTVDFAPAIDVHTHLGFSFYRAPEVDLQASHDRVRYYFDCDEEGANCELDLDLYANQSISESALEAGSNAIIQAALTGATDGPQMTHTIPNELVEMDALGIGRAFVLPIGGNFDPDYDADNPSELWATAIEEAGAGDRLLAFGSVHPDDPGKLDKLERYAALGLRGIKLHPSMQLTAPDDPATMEIYPVCDRLRLPVFFHSGRTGLEVANQAEYCNLERYQAPVREFPNLDFVLGHSGAVLDFDAAIALAKECPNVWLCLAGPSVPALERLVAELGPERLMFGTDWPFYPMAYQLSKVLIATRCDAVVRDLLLSGNAERFLEKWAPST